MLFTSSIFLYGFLPVVFAAYLLLGRFSKTVWPIISFLVVASFVFYGYQSPYNVFLLAFSITANYGLARLIQKGLRPGLSLFAGVVFNLGLLGYFKYANFFLDNLEVFTGGSFTDLNIVLPLAISFYTFQQIAFLADSKAGKVKDVSFQNYLLFVTFFPQLIIGPIVHHSEMMPQFARPDLGKIKWNDFVIGATYLFSGIVKKLFIADPLGVFVDQIHVANAAGDMISFSSAWFAAFAFSMQIYFDFSGYTDMAIGLAKLFGIDLPINFNSPYKARNIAEFWRRWHITLSRWLRDYLYIPLGGNRRGLARAMINAFAVFFLGGLWHGAAWSFVVWGLMHGAGVSVFHALEKFKFALPRIFGIAVTFMFVTLSWVLFRAESFAGAIKLYKNMFTIPETINMPGSDVPYVVLVIALLIVFALPNTHQSVTKTADLLMKLPKVALLGVILIVWLSLVAFDLDSSAEFIYFDF